MKGIVVVGLLVVLVGLLALVSVVDECSATDIIVDTGGNGDYLTIQEGIDNSSNGDTVFVWAGTYSENVELNVSISLVGNGSSSTIIDDGSVGAVLNISSSWCNVTGFNITASNSNGINISVDNVTISDTVVYSNDGHGLYIFGNHTDVRYCDIFSNILNGVYVDGDFASFLWCNISSNDKTGIGNTGGLIITPNLIMSWCNISGNEQGGYLFGDNMHISNCSFSSHLVSGIHIGGDYITIRDCNISSNGGNGIVIASTSKYTSIINNIFNTNTQSGINMGIHVWDSVFSHNTLVHNGFNGIVVNVFGKNNRFDNNSLVSESGSYGMQLSTQSHHNTIENNTLVSENEVGIKLTNSDYNVIQYNNISTNSNQGIWLTSGSDWNTIAFTTFYDNLVGVQIDSSSNNSVYNCTFELNDYGINITGNSYDNHIYYNEFIENVVQADDGFATIWDDGISRGNYWSDYLGVDLDGDGIGDTLLDHLGFDQYPIVHAVSPPEPEEEDEEEAGVGSTIQTLLVGILPLIVIVSVFKLLRKNMDDVTVDKKKEMVAGGRRRRRRGKL